MALGVAYIVTGRAAHTAECEQALALARNLTDVHAAIALGKIFLGRPGEIEGHIREAFASRPVISLAFAGSTTSASPSCSLALTEAVTWLGRSIESNRNYPNARFFSAPLWLYAAV